MWSKGYNRVLTSTLSNEQAQFFYRKLGYTDAGAILLPDEPLEIILLKNLKSKKGDDTFLETERLILRKFQENDLDDLCEVVIDPERNRMMGNDEISSVDEAKGLLEWFLYKEERAYALVLKATGRVVGDLTVQNEPPEEIKALPELAGKIGRSLSFSISRQYRRQGLMFEAVNAVIEQLFRVERVDYIHSGYLDFNIPSQQLHKKLGFTYLTTQRFRREEGGEELVGIENVLWRE